MNLKEYDNWYENVFRKCEYSKLSNDKSTVCYFSNHKYCNFEQCTRRD